MSIMKKTIETTLLKQLQKNLFLFAMKIVDGMRRNVQTGLGLSVGDYQQSEGEMLMTGEILGKANVPVLLLLQKDQMLKAYSSTERGTVLPSPNMASQIEHKGVMFVDDRKAHIGGDGNNEDFEDNFTKGMTNKET